MPDTGGGLGLIILQIIWIDLLLSGDNAVVIALACRSVPVERRLLAVCLGAGVAVAMRIAFTLGLQFALYLPWLKLAGAIAMLWIAVKLMIEDDDDHAGVGNSRTVLGAVRTIVIADAIMSLDNVLAVAAAARGHPVLIALGLALSIPLIVIGASLIIGLLTSMPILVWAGAALLGWIAGQLVIEEPVLQAPLAHLFATLGLSSEIGGTLICVAGAIIVVLIGALTPRPQRATERD
jgi:YjbE family integral membrane protein